MSKDSLSYIPLEIEYLGLEQETRFDIYSENETGKVLLVERGTRLTEPLLKSLVTARNRLFVNADDQKEVHSLIQRNLARILADEGIPDEEKSRIFHTAAADSLKALFQQPGQENILHAKAVIDSTTDLIIQSDQATHTLFSLAGHDYYTYTHSCNVGIFGLGLTKALLGEADSLKARRLGQAFFFHDIGKIKVASEIIQKPGRLNRDEWAEMQHHPDYGLELLEEYDLLTPEARDVVHQHHEKPDGSGYPGHLKGDRISTFARICTVVDVFDALSSERSYRPRNTAFEAFQIMLKEMAESFDSEILAAFIQLIKKSEMA